MTDPDGHTISYSYNADNEETTETWMNPSGGSALDVITLYIQRRRRVTKVQDNNSAYEYTYNGDGDETSFSDAGTPGPGTGDPDLQLRRRQQPHQHDRQPGRGGQLHVRQRVTS